MRLKRIGDTFYIKTWKYDEVEYPKRVIQLMCLTQHGVTQVILSTPSKFSWYLFSQNGKSYHMPTTILGTYNHEILPKPKNARDMIIKKAILST